MYLGFKDYAHQGGINEKGLCFDANALPDSRINLHPELIGPPHYEPPYEQYAMWVPVLILKRAATVEEAIDLAKRYDRKNWYPDSEKINYQLNLADATGDAVVISVDKNGELAFTRKHKNENFLISTNYNRVNPENAWEYPCQRYRTTEKILGAINTENDLTVAAFRSILDTVHQEGIFDQTLYSNVFDLKNGIIYLYYRHQFDEVVTLKVNEQLAKGKFIVPLEELFSKETVKVASNEYLFSLLLLGLGAVVATGVVIAMIRYLKKRWPKVKMH